MADCEGKSVRSLFIVKKKKNEPVAPVVSRAALNNNDIPETTLRRNDLSSLREKFSARLGGSWQTLVKAIITIPRAQEDIENH